VLQCRKPTRQQIINTLLTMLLHNKEQIKSIHKNVMSMLLDAYSSNFFLVWLQRMQLVYQMVLSTRKISIRNVKKRKFKKSQPNTTFLKVVFKEKKKKDCHGSKYIYIQYFKDSLIILWGKSLNRTSSLRFLPTALLTTKILLKILNDLNQLLLPKIS